MFSKGKLCKLSRTFKMYNRQFVQFARIDLVSVYISTLVCLEVRKLFGLIGSLQKTNQVAIGSIRVFWKLGCVFINVYRTIFDPPNKPGWIYKRLPNQAIRNGSEFT